VDRFTVGILALVAQRERELISERTKAALTAAKSRGTRLGGCSNPQHRCRMMAHANVQAAHSFHRLVLPVISAVKRKARGYRTVEYMTTMLYFVAGKLTLPCY
jgi:DNA invertase Pin-like site-specific DNA recombinase